jgi:hypothetical protein
MLVLLLGACGIGTPANDGAPDPPAQPALYVIDALVRSVAGVDLHVRYAERQGDNLTLALALYNNTPEAIMVLDGVALDHATLVGAAPATLAGRSASWERGVVPDEGWLPNGASNGTLTFAGAAGTRFTFTLPGFPPVQFRLDTPLRAAPEPPPPADGVYDLGFEARSVEAPGVRLRLLRVEVGAEELLLHVTQLLDPSLTQGVSMDAAALLDARWNQYRVQGVDAGMAETLGDGTTEAVGAVLRFARPRAGNVVLLRVPSFPLIRIPLRVDAEPAWATARDLPPSYAPRAALAVAEQPLARADDPDAALRRLLDAVNTAFQTGDGQTYLDAFVPQARAAQEALFERTRTLPVEDITLTVPEQAPDVPPLGPDDRTVVRPALWSYRVREVAEHNVFSTPVEVVLERDGDAWRIGEIAGALPFWASGPTEAQRSGAFWIFFRPPDRGLLSAIEADVEAAFSRVRAALPSSNGPFVVTVALTAEEFEQQSGRDPERFVGAALSRWRYTASGMEIDSASFVLNGVVFGAAPASDRQQTIAHELTHLALAGQTMPYTPLWLAEGAAMYVSDDVPVARMQEAWASGAVESWSLESFTATRRFGEHDPQGVETALDYAYSAYLVRYLVATYGWERVLQFYAAFGEVDTPSLAEDMAEAADPALVEPVMSRLGVRLTSSLLQSSFGVDLVTFEQNFKTWLADEIG